MSILLREIRAGRNSWLAWTVSLCFLTFLIVWIYPAVARSSEAFIQYVDSLPPQLTAAFGLDRISFADPVGFFGIEAYSLILLFGSIYTALLGATILVKEESEKTAEFLLAKPLSRAAIVSQKAAAVLVYVALFNLAVTVVSLVSFRLFVEQSYRIGTIIQLMAGSFFCTLTFAAIGLLLSSALRRVRTAYTLALGGVLATYFLSIFSELSDKLEWVKYLTPFRYVEAADIMTSGLSPTSVALLLGVTAASTGAAYLVYGRKDIHV
ncbi:MAG: ABC transporter permease subunit [Limnochordales bacterium]|nr:ABC transporter permease subunit [Limnochordales bacterium]